MRANQKFESAKDEAPSHHCNLSDSEVVHKIAQILLLGLVTACVDNISGNCFKSHGSVAVDIRKEMVTNCPFYHVCCHSSIPYCTMEQHCSEFLQSYLVFILKTFHKEAPELSSVEHLSGAKDVRSLTKIVVDISLKVVDFRGCRSAATNTSLKVMSFN